MSGAPVSHRAARSTRFLPAVLPRPGTRRQYQSKARYWAGVIARRTSGASTAALLLLIATVGHTPSLEYGHLPEPKPYVADSTTTHDQALLDQADKTARLMDAHRCSHHGLPDGTIAAHAVILDAHDKVRLVSFDHGWAIHLGERPGALIAVCAS